MRSLLLLPALLGLATAAAAQGAAVAPAAGEPLEGRLNQKIERIRVEDAGTRIDEVRVGGQTQSITVQPKIEGIPEYEVQPGSLQRGRPVDPRQGPDSGGGQRSWNILRF